MSDTITHVTIYTLCNQLSNNAQIPQKDVQTSNQ